MQRSLGWRYGVCGLLLLASMLLYMDRLTLAQLATTICAEYQLSNTQYGLLDTGFSLAFACGAICFGVLVDRIGPRWLYPAVVIAWSCAGMATAYAQDIGAWLRPDAGSGEQAYLGFMVCRVALGIFESGHWPCALVTTQIILPRGDRSLGNSILQSGAALGAIITPVIVLAMLTERPGGWQPPFFAIGLVGLFWAIPWLLMIGRQDLHRAAPALGEGASPADIPVASHSELWRMFAVLAITVIAINLTWQYFRVWLPKYLEESHGYSKAEVGWFTSAYYVSADFGCISIGILVKWLIAGGWDVHRARLWTFTGCTALTLLAVAVAFMPTGPWLLVLLLLVGAGTLGLFPNYYSFTQELSRKHQGKISGSLGTITWIGTAIMQALVGESIDATKSYVAAIVLAGVYPLFACLAFWLLWPAIHPGREPERQKLSRG